MPMANLLCRSIFQAMYPTLPSHQLVADFILVAQ
jgi:hypothetical protein